MNLSDLHFAAADNFWLAILPEILLGLIALLLLVLELVLPKRHHPLIPAVSIAAQLGILGALLVHFREGLFLPESFNGLLYHSAVGQFMRVFFVLTSILVSFLGTIALAKQRLPRIEFFHIVLVVTAGLMLLAQANHFLLLFVALETVTIGFYILVSYFRTSPLSLEAGLKYLVLGGLSSALLLFGITLLYGVAGDPALAGHAADPFSFPALRQFLALNPDNSLASLGIVLVLCGVAFKIGAVPFQIWVPDVYQGAPTPVTAFLAVGSKAAGFALLLILANVFVGYQELVVALLGLLAAATILFGNFAALTQYNVKRLMGLSGVAHAGYLLLGVVAAVSEPLALGAILFYLFAYLLAAMAVFGVMTHLAGPNDAEQTLDDYHGLAKTQPFLAIVLVVGLGSLAGLPPLAGFVGKLLIFIAAFKAGLYPLLAVAIVGVVVSIYYYFGWIKAACFAHWHSPTELAAQPTAAPTVVTPVAAAILGLLALSSVVLGFYQGNFGDWFLPLAQ